MEPPRLFHAEHLSVRLAYQNLFSPLPIFPPHGPAVSSPGGRPRIDRNALLRALVYRALRRLVSLSDLVQALRENPALLEAIGLDPLGDIPSVERFSGWLRSTPNDSLQDIRIRLLQTLFAEGAFTGRILALDSCPLLSPVRDRFNKERFPQGDPTARLGVLTSFARGDSRKVIYFWGYRNHVVVDTETELPLWEQTEPADRKDSPLAVPLLRALLDRLHLPVEAVCGDTAYDADALRKFTVEELHAQPPEPTATFFGVPRCPSQILSAEGLQLPAPHQPPYPLANSLWFRIVPATLSRAYGGGTRLLAPAHHRHARPADTWARFGSQPLHHRPHHSAAGRPGRPSNRLLRPPRLCPNLRSQPHRLALRKTGFVKPYFSPRLWKGGV